MADMSSLNWFDFAIILLLAASVISGLKAGLSRVVIHLLATVIGLLAAFWCYGIVAEKLLTLVNVNRLQADLLGFLIIFLGVLLVGSLLAALLGRIFRWFGLSWFDHLLGGVAGVVRGVLVITVMVDALIAFTPRPPPAYLDHSRLLPYTNEIAGWLIEAAPRGLKDAFKDQLGNIEQYWTPRDQKDRGQEEI